MASDLERLDADVRAVAADGATNARMIESARSHVGSLVQQVAGMRIPDVDLSRLKTALADAETKLASARDLVQTANARARGYAGSHLASGGGSPAAAPATTVAAPADPLESALASHDVRMAAVDDFDFSGNPITSWKGKPDRQDIEWAVSRWDDTLAPGIARGMTRDDFAAADAAANAPDYRRLANVWDAFLGHDAIHTGGGTTPSGGLDVDGGRHRLQVARDLGIRFLPIRFH